MRKNPTAEERKLWHRLRARQVRGKKFRRQYVLEPFIVDFCCVSEKLVIEVDGASHRGQRDQDHHRDTYLYEVYEVSVVRVGTDEVLMDIEDVLERIRAALG